MGRLTSRRRITTIDLAADPVEKHRVDTLIAEEPMELRVDGTSLAVTMRTPGHDIELAHGFLLTEGIIGGRTDVINARYCAGSVEGENTYNIIDVAAAPGIVLPEGRNFYTTSSCGICGKASIDAITTQLRHDPGADASRWPAELIAQLPDRLREQQGAFDKTGGLHAAGLFDATGEALVVREDVGRHNAVDKVIGWAVLQDRLPLSRTALVVSGRASFELAQKAAMAGIPLLVAVSAPSSLAVEFAERVGMTLAGFVRGRRMNVYTRPERVQVTAPVSA
ncbi:FdhD protein [Naumannella cuiyingiana]|uniref:Sulfur carrier protein FdhD n=1 Tax=Naumannella cuiyingiana TaxID=1347891 RepID=A0A7Z0IKN2_9ACTN|nr:formate dehydrogenase accessory sulfurtransferase FdhD [Naumannella cuiyingiana]NYI70627.1 FdhD protein [Naumannella cuiyingiana]